MKSGKMDQWDKYIFSGTEESLIFVFKFGSFILQCFLLKGVGWEGRKSQKQICTFPSQLEFFSSFTAKGYKSLLRFVFVIFLSESLLLLNSGDAKIKRLGCPPSAKDMQAHFSSLGLC